MGWVAPILFGTPDIVAEELQRYSESGIDGILLVFPEWEQGLERFRRLVLPLLEEAGLREPLAGFEQAGSLTASQAS
jgi:alkanesulfonate monooxygenase SsuD/methylene tetrahydromethanopterin reductase-like flavin-dependent oxidoreductase (luciferase family)